MSRNSHLFTSTVNKDNAGHKIVSIDNYEITIYCPKAKDIVRGTATSGPTICSYCSAKIY